MRKASTLQVEEMPGDEFPDLESAQRAALPAMSASLQVVIRDLLESGELIIVDGKIVPNPEKVDHD
jgi:hypothetical protein